MLLKHTSFNKLVCAAVVSASLITGVHSARGQDGVKLSLSDNQATAKRELPKVDEKTVFRRLIEGFIPDRQPAEVAPTGVKKVTPSDNRSSVGPPFAGGLDVGLTGGLPGETSASSSSSIAPHGQFSVTPASAAQPLAMIAQSQLIEAQVTVPGSEDQVEILPPATSAPRYQTPKGIEALTSQGKLFGALWGANNAEEVESRFLTQQQTFPLGPAIRTFASDEYGDRMAAFSTYTWAAPAVYHKPLYFEQVNLERYGQGPHHLLQPAFSASHFFVNIAKLPYHIGATPPCEDVYVLGHYRPGNCAPHQWHKPRPSWRGLMYQGVASGGLGVLIAP